MKPASHNNSRVLRILAGWCGLWLYVGALSPVGFAVTAFLGGLDPDHQVRLQPGEKGMRLVLHHEGNCAGHHHGAVARVLTAFAQPASATDPDHVLQFSSATGLTQDSQFVVPVANQFESSAIAFAEPVSFVATSPVQFVPPPRPPPGGDGRLLCLRSTLLLI